VQACTYIFFKKEFEMVKKTRGMGIFIFLMLAFLIGCKGDSSPVSPVVSNGVVGTWVEENGLEYTFSTDGKVTGSAIEAVNAFFVLAGQPEPTWTYNATQILMNGQPSTSYTVNNNKLTMKNSKGEDIVLTKK
jgi:hypothetical protein